MTHNNQPAETAEAAPAGADLASSTPAEPTPEAFPAISAETDAELEAGAPELAALTRQIAISQAASLARAGQYPQADALLDTLQGQETAEILDLRARIRAQQGRLGEAQALWERALTLDSGNPDYLEGLDYIRKAQKPVRMQRIFSAGFWLGLAVLLGLILGAVWLNSWNRSLQKAVTELHELTQDVRSVVQEVDQPGGEAVSTAPSPAAETSTAKPVQAETGITMNDLEGLRQDLLGAATANQDSLAEQVAALQSGQAAILAGLQPTTATATGFQIDLPGIKLTPTTEGTQIQFDEGLFDYGWTLKPESRSLLSILGARLADYGSDVQIKLIGFQLDDEADKYFPLGLLRAVVVYDYLVSNTQLTEEAFSILPQGARRLPFPLDTPTDRRRNMTVEMIISQGNR